MNTSTPDNPKREFALKVVRTLQDAGYIAWWAGGCVRDMIMGREPRDYDVATNATPAEVRQLFGKRRTLAIGESFGVITVQGGKEAGQVEVATFRRDEAYSDGRHPDGVEFCDPREDALRRDFTINGIFYDPVTGEYHDFVNGRADIDCRIIRAIGDPHLRIDEDKLRMLRAVRFATELGFEIEAETFAAIRQHAPEITAVSPERIGMEMRRMLAHPNRHVGAELLSRSKLLDYILQDGHLLYRNRANWRTRLRWLQQLGDRADFVTAAAVLLSPLLKQQGVEPTAARWRLSNAEQKSIAWLEQNTLTLSRAHLLPWSQVQPLLVHPDAGRALLIATVMFGEHHPGVRYCQSRMEWPREKLDPLPWITGQDLIDLGLKPGPQFSRILKRIRAAQLDGELAGRQQAIDVVRGWIQHPETIGQLAEDEESARPSPGEKDFRT